MVDIASGYFDTALEKRDKVIGQALKVLKHRSNDYDVIVCRGYSGMTVAPILAWALKKPIFIVRKDGESTHSSEKSFMGTLGDRYLMIDDFVGTGNTIRTIRDYLKIAHDRAERPEGMIVGLYLYESYDDDGVYENIPTWGTDHVRYRKRKQCVAA